MTERPSCLFGQTESRRTTRQNSSSRGTHPRAFRSLQGGGQTMLCSDRTTMCARKWHQAIKGKVCNDLKITPYRSDIDLPACVIHADNQKCLVGPAQQNSVMHHWDHFCHPFRFSLDPNSPSCRDAYVHFYCPDQSTARTNCCFLVTH